MPLKVSIIGAAGGLGACTAFRMSTLGLADELVLIDRKENLLKSHLFDIETAVTGMHDIVLRRGEKQDLEGSDIVIITAGAPWRVVSSRMEKLDENLPIIREMAENLSEYCPGAVVITATNPVDPLNAALNHYSGIDRHRLLGYTVNDTTRFIKQAAKALDVSSTWLQGLVIGEHGESAVLLFSSLLLDGKPVEISEELKARIREEHKNNLKATIALQTGWTSGWTSAVGLSRMVAAIAHQKDETIPCSVLLEGEYGIDGISIGVPVKLGPAGVREFVQSSFTPEEAEEFQQSAAYLHEITDEMNAVL
ncbi:MAG: hypothetical protein K9J79_10975 [Desulfobacteraceae bacterium]|nr:hypothetical protein [Desulfobacteraceae bacterium]